MTAPHNPLLSAPVLPLLARFALPNMGALLAAALASISETIYAGRLGLSALAGLALVFPMVMLQGMLSSGAMGSSVASTISRALGAGQTGRAQALAVHAAWIGLAGGVLYMAAMLAGGEALFGLLGGRGDALRHAVDYAQVAFLGAVFVWVVNVLSAVIRGTGRMAVPSAALLLISLAQVGISGALGLGWGPFPALGMRGVAAGQVVAYGVGALALLGWLLSGRAGIQLPLWRTPLRAEAFAAILRASAVACVSPLQTVATILILTRLVAQFGTEALAGYGVGTRLEFLLVPIAFAVGVASVPLVGMAVGAGQVARARRVAWTAAAMAGAMLGLIGVVVTVRPDVWSRLFTQEATVLASAASYFHWAGPCYALFGVGLSLYFSAVGAGRAAGPVMAGTLRLVVVAVGGAALAQAAAPAWMIFALVALGMAAYGLASVALVRRTSWER
ncbi:MAG: MATE family efflux transporter [Acidovorax sp.]